MLCCRLKDTCLRSPAMLNGRGFYSIEGSTYGYDEAQTVVYVFLSWLSQTLALLLGCLAVNRYYYQSKIDVFYSIW